VKLKEIFLLITTSLRFFRNREYLKIEKSKTMNIRNIKIITQLQIGFSILLLFVFMLGVISFLQSNKIQQQTEIMYSHPLKVRQALGSLKADILSMRLENRNLMLAKNLTEQQTAVKLMEISSDDVQRQFAILRELYLGPSTDIEIAYNAFISWKISRDENTKLALSGKIEEVKESVLSTGTVGILRDNMLASIKVIDDFAVKKADLLYANSKTLFIRMNRQMILLLITITLFILLVSYILLMAVRKPIDELIQVTKRFHDGDLDARSTYTSKNEFGILSESFNKMVDNIQVKNSLDEKFSTLASLMLSEYDTKKFFHSTLNVLADQTGSQMAAIYLLSENKKQFDHFESIGVDENARRSFSAEHFEGEFGTVLSTQQVHHLFDIPENTRFVFQTVNGKFIPSEIITIPIIVNNEVVAILSLASINKYSQQSLLLINRIHITLCSRVEGILAYHKVNKMRQKLELQNSELETQKTELATQSNELIEQNTELEMQKNLLGEANRLKTNFLSNMSHELRTPLNSVIALSGVLNRRLAKRIPDEEYSYLEVIERNGKHLLNLINDILDISRIESGREEVEITTFKPCSLVNELINMIQPQAKQKNIDLLKVGGDCEVSISSDADKCSHILQNLIANAVKFTEKGKVQVTVAQIDTKIAITVADTGIGITEDHLLHIFDEFRQADSSTSRRFGGTGLGLAIAKKYANLLGGTISVKSTSGSGSEFTLLLPLRYAIKNRILDIESETVLNTKINFQSLKLASNETSKTILLVEDSEPAIIQMKDFLEDSGYHILVAHDGAEALGTIEKTIPDAMILDLMMPDIDGFEVLKILRNAEQTAHIPVLILTAKHITKEELQFLKRNNIHQLIQKGDVNRDELLNAVVTMVTPKKAETVSHRSGLQKIEGKPVVLIVEDNPDNMITVKAILSSDFTVLEAIDGYSSIEMAKKHLPHLILMDIALPDIDGITAFKAIRKDAQLQHTPIIALTASAMLEDRESILAHGFDAFIVKPIDNELFFNTINEVLYGKRND